MCAPRYFEIAYEINPWMNTKNQVNTGLAQNQWERLYSYYKDHGVEVELIEPQKGLPDMVFVANGGLVYKNTFICSRQRFKERSGEETYFQIWFTDHGYVVKTVEHHFSGEGDALWYRGVLYMGYGFRSQREAHQEVGDILGIKPISLHLVNEYFYDFDTLFCPIGDKLLLYYPDGYDAPSQEILKQIPDSYALTKAQAETFICNSVLVGNTFCTPFIDAQLTTLLAKYGITPKVFEYGEYKKSGGSVKCTTLYLK